MRVYEGSPEKYFESENIQQYCYFSGYCQDLLSSDPYLKSYDPGKALF